jgi:8-oxo-dGTP diphosphatase
MEELARVRRRVAHLEHNKRVAVTVFSRNEDGAYLLMRRHDDAGRCAGLWMAPGGVVERGETIEQAARREVLEEIGCQIGRVEVRQILLDVSSDLVLVNVRADLVPWSEPWVMEPEKHGPPQWLRPEAIEKLREDAVLPGSALAYFFGVGV